MSWQKPRFKLAYLIAVVAVAAVEFSLLPSSFSAGVAGLTVFASILAAVLGPFTKLEWAIIVMIHAVLIALLAPAVKSSHSHARKPGPSTIAPVSNKI
jgi:hypothetical protein